MRTRTVNKLPSIVEKTMTERRRYLFYIPINRVPLISLISIDIFFFSTYFPFISPLKFPFCITVDTFIINQYKRILKYIFPTNFPFKSKKNPFPSVQATAIKSHFSLLSPSNISKMVYHYRRSIIQSENCDEQDNTVVSIDLGGNNGELTTFA